MFSDQEKIDAILKWAKKKPFFDTSFVMSCDEQLKTSDYGLSCAQKKGLSNIIKKFHISKQSVYRPPHCSMCSGYDEETKTVYPLYGKIGTMYVCDDCFIDCPGCG